MDLDESGIFNDGHIVYERFVMSVVWSTCRQGAALHSLLGLLNVLPSPSTLHQMETPSRHDDDMSSLSHPMVQHHEALPPEVEESGFVWRCLETKANNMFQMWAELPHLTEKG